MPGPRKPRATPKTQGGLRKVTFTIEADEATLQRLATLLLFARIPAKEEYEDPPGLPWPLALDGEEAVMPPVEDPEATRQEIVRWFTAYIERHGVELARRMLTEYGAETASALRHEQLGPFLADLQRSMPWFK